MAEPDLLERLRPLRFVEGIPEEDLKRYAAVARLEEYPAGAVVFREGQQLTRIFLVSEGNIALEVRPPGEPARRLHTVGPGELLGWSPVLGGGPMTATARAMALTRLVAFDAAQVLAQCHHDPRFGFLFMKRTAEALAARLNATRLQLLDVFRDQLPVIADEVGGPR
jgi:CRP-like cAMP-binding protein